MTEPVDQPVAAQSSGPHRRRIYLWWWLVGVVLLVGLAIIWLKASTGLRGSARRAWKGRAIAEIAARAADARGLAAEAEGMRARTAADPESEAWISEHLLAMKNGEWIACASICSKEDWRIPDLFIGRGSDGKWYYSTFHFCKHMIVLRMDEQQPRSLAKFVSKYYLQEFDGRSDECLAKTWPPGPGQTDHSAPRAVPFELEPLIAALKDPDDEVRRHAAYALGELRDQRAVEPLIAALKDEDDDVRRCATGALGDLKDLRAVEPLIAALKDTNSAVRELAARALYSLKDPRTVEPLIVALKDPDSSVRSSAAHTLGETKDPRAVEPLAAVLKDPDFRVRRSATWSLGKLHDPRAVEMLKLQLNDSDSYVRGLAKQYIDEIEAQTTPPEPKP